MAKKKKYSDEKKEKLLEQYEESGLSITDFAESKKMSRGTLSNWLNAPKAKQKNKEAPKKSSAHFSYEELLQMKLVIMSDTGEGNLPISTKIDSLLKKTV